MNTTQNALEELMDTLENVHKNVKDIAYLGIFYDDPIKKVFLEAPILWSNLNFLDFEYDSYYYNFSKEVNGFIVFKDGTWLSRCQWCDFVCWEYNQCPTLEKIRSLTKC